MTPKSERNLLQPSSTNPATQSKATETRYSSIRAVASTQPANVDDIRWLTELEYATRYRISRQTLANWRHQERHGAAKDATRPIWVKIGRCIRYRVNESGLA